MAHLSLLVLAVLLVSSTLSTAEYLYGGDPEEVVVEDLAEEHDGDWFPKLLRKERSRHIDSPAYRYYVNSRVSNASIQADLYATDFFKMCKILYSNQDDSDNPPLVLKDKCRWLSFKCSSITKVYRTSDGTCNNIHRPGCGRSNSAFLRLLPAHYYDGIYQVRRSVTRHRLPGVREIQMKIFGDKEISSNDYTQYFMQWVQFVAHDMSLSPMKQTAYGPIQCCTRDGSSILPRSKLSDACYPIYVSPHDPVYKRHGVRCMEFVRAMTAVPDDCVVQPATPMNAVTSHLDLSVLYGNDDMTIRGLRVYKAGNLSVSDFPEGPFMPLMPHSPHPCASQHPSDTVCFKSGDTRTNLHPLRSAMQVLMLRGHNRLAKLLWKLNPHWTEEKTFQESRRLLIAIWQHVIYDEILPLLIGKKAHHKYFSVYKYDKNLCAGTYVEFATVAFRYLHTIIHGNQWLMTPEREITNEIVMSDFYNRPSVVTKAFEEIMIGSVSQKCRKGDDNYEKQVAHELFKINKFTYGLSLPCIDIQRGRDHGVPPYNKLRKLCGLPEAYDFNDLYDTMSHASIMKLRSTYKDVDDIDALVGGALETKVPGALFGPTFVCLVVKQFRLTQRSDRFFYLNKDQEHPLSQRQIEAIRRSSAASFLCINTNIGKIARKSFETVSDRNPLVDCSEILRVDLSEWKEHDASMKEESSWATE